MAPRGARGAQAQRITQAAQPSRPTRDLTPAGAWLRVSGSAQHEENQVPDVEAFAAHHGLAITSRYTVDDSAWKNGGGPVYKATLAKAMDDAWQGKFSVLVVWSLDRIVRNGAEDALRIIRQLRERGCTLVSVKESWLNSSPEVQDVLVAFAGWMAEMESRRRSERVKAGQQRRLAQDPDFRLGRKPGARDVKVRNRSGYVKRWEEHRERNGQ